MAQQRKQKDEKKQPDYSAGAMSHLAERTEYEAWLLEAVYSIAEKQWFPTFPDSIIYPVNSSKPEFSENFDLESIVTGHWRSEFLNVGAPLVFVTTFKLLDMFIEWIHENNERKKAPFQFEKKKTYLQEKYQPPIFPSFIESKPWLKERLIGFYGFLGPLRNTIIHDRHFTSSNGTINVSSRKKKGQGITSPVEISSSDLGTLAFTVVSILKYVNNTWSLDQYHEKSLRYKLDRLTRLHGLPSLEQRAPFYPTVRVYSTNPDPRIVDLSAILSDIKKQYPSNDCMFDLRVLIVKGGAVVDAFRFSWVRLENERFKWDNISSLEEYQVSIPDDIELKHLAESK